MWAAALVGFGLFDIGEGARIGYWVGTAFSAVLAASVSIGAAQAFARSHWKRLRSPGVGSRRLYTRGCVLGLFTVTVGAAGAIAVSRVIESFLFETDPHDPLSLAVTIVALATTTLVAAWIPARRAARVDPVTTLRHS